MAIRTLNNILKAADLPTGWLFEYLLNLKEPLRDMDLKIRSPFSRDTNASFSIYKTPSGNYRFKCFSTGLLGNPFDLLIALEKNKGFDITLQEAKNRLIKAFNQADILISYDRSNASGAILNTKAKVVEWEMDRWNDVHLNFWSSYGITQKILEEYNVCALKRFLMEKVSDGEIKNFEFNHQLQFGYFRKDGSLHKIYKPGQKPKAIKVGSNYLEGEDQIIQPKENLLITKSTKDIMGFMGLEIENWDCVSCDSENVIISKKVIDDKKNIYKKIIVLFDNDKAGENAGLEYKNKYGITPIKLDMPGKDLTDNIKDHSQMITKIKLMQLL